jgi:hypothetical protein
MHRASFRGRLSPTGRSTPPVIALLWALAVPAAAQTPAGEGQPNAVEDLRKEITALREDYARRIAELESRISALEKPAATAEVPQPAVSPPTPAVPSAPPAQVPLPPAAPKASAEVPPGASGAGGPTGPLPVYGGGAAASKVFNPDIAAIGNFIGAAGKTPGGGEPSLEMHESELSFQAVVDPYARADFFLTFGPDEVGVEEGFITFPTLPGGLLMKVGKMRDAFGKIDGLHAHLLPFIDRPLVTQNLTGGEDGLADSGISVSRLIPIPGLFLEATGQVYRGESEIFKAPTRGDLTYLGHVRDYQDLSESSNIDVGGSIAYGHNGVGPETTTRLFGVDATFRYRPLRRSIYTHVLARGEATWSRRGDLLGTQKAFGAYGYLEWQFARRWFAGARYDVSDRADDASLRDKGGSFLLTYWPSEFSQVRGQFRHTRFGEGRTANELLFQFLFSIGAHGAHPF